MEFGERKRSRKSQSFKLLSAEVAVEAPISVSKDATAVPSEDWVGEDGMEIKRQITGMMKILSDRSGRGYQRVGPVLSQDRGEDGGQSSLWLPDDDHVWTSVEGIAPSTLPSTHTNAPGTRSRGQRELHSTKDLTKALQVSADTRPPSTEPPCCMCNCKDTLQAILQELQVMRTILQSEKEKQEPNAVLPCQPALHGPTPPHRPLKRRPIYKVPPLAECSARHEPVSPVPVCAPVFAPVSAHASTPAHSREIGDAVKPVDTFRALGQSIDAQPDSANSDTTSLLHPPSKHLESEPEVRLVEDYDVFISKAQLDSILINYTRSGSLLFRKLVCAFFNDATLANSLPNGKRKRGLNDYRKGLDQNIVGAVKAFTEKYCIEHNIEKLPGPRDWVQILQDQIKLARRRLRRDAAEDKI
ncbi:BEN domain-containing protein 7 [Boleophthalmus pectinirostris]|uniref:BEN domain-containing protein 7 n=1 Tax=Boleophthalmus pectinirostris TaxID=150288 RepID=UPI00242EDE36|nr:BEN domain-containing protein 7 [Boleophthalmus pectinirostris]